MKRYQIFTEMQICQCLYKHGFQLPVRINKDKIERKMFLDPKKLFKQMSNLLLDAIKYWFFVH